MAIIFLLIFLRIEAILEVNVSDVSGDLFVAVYDNESDFMDKEVFQTIAKVKDENVIIDLPLSDGEYAISVFHDLNGNKELDKNWMGIPTEPYGFSNNARGKFGPPTYNQCKVKITDGTTRLTIKLD